MSQLTASHGTCSCFYCCIAVQLSGADASLTDQVVSELCINSKYQPASEIWKETMATGAYSLTIPCCVRGCHVYQRVRVSFLAFRVLASLLLLHVVSNYTLFSNFALIEGQGSVSNCASSAKNEYVFCDA